MKRKIVLLICCILILAGLFLSVGCGSSNGGSGAGISGSGE